MARASASPAPTTTPEPTAPSTTEPPSAAAIAVKQAGCRRALAPGFRCVTLTVPLDHFAAGPGTARVTFALRRHTGPGKAKGVWVTATGGPGTSGIASASSYTSSFAAGIRRDYDIVFFDQRGAALSEPITCPDAALAWYTVQADAAGSTPSTGLGAAAQRFVTDCIAEGKIDPARLPYYSTRQAVEDLEAFRLWLGTDKLTLYGESYGSQFVQTYAQAHPEHVRALFIDGPVDLSVSGQDFAVEQARAFDDALVGTLLDCSSQLICTRTVTGGNALNAYDRLAAKLATGPIGYRFVRASGKAETREFTATDLVNAASAYVYSEYDRMLLQRAVAAASQGNLWYLARLVTAGLVQDPETGAAIPDPTYSDALYYAVECTDYAEFSGTPEERAAAWFAAGTAAGMDDNRMGSIFFGDLPCAWWPAHPADAGRPAPLTDTPYPLFILGATLDPATPWANAERIYARNRDTTHLIVKPGGPHIIYGRGEACPDALVTAYLVRDVMPSARRTVCPGDVADTYVPIPPSRARRYLTTETALRSTDDEINTATDYQAWDGEGTLATGCPFGGFIHYRSAGAKVRIVMTRCSWSRGLPLTGTGVIAADGGMTLDVASNKDLKRVVHYERGARGKLLALTGTFGMFGGR